MRTASRRVKKKTAVINADIESALSGIRTAKAFANEPVEAEKFTRSNDTYKTSKKQFHKEMGIFMGTMSSLRPRCPSRSSRWAVCSSCRGRWTPSTC